MFIKNCTVTKLTDYTIQIFKSRSFLFIYNILAKLVCLCIYGENKNNVSVFQLFIVADSKDAKI
jgi:hypothetical protein